MFFFQLLLFSNNFRILALINLFSPWYFDSFNNLKRSSEFMFQYWCNYHEHCQNFYSIIHFVFMKFIFFVKRLLWCVTKFSTIGRCLGQHQTKSNECITMDGWCFEHDIVSQLYFYSLTIVPNKYGSRTSQGFYYWGSTIWMISKLEKGDCVLGLLCLFPYFVLPLFFLNLCIWTLQYCIFS